MSDSEDSPPQKGPGPETTEDTDDAPSETPSKQQRSRSASRRARRQKQTNKQKQQQQKEKGMPPVEEDASAEAEADDEGAQAQAQAEEPMSMQPFEHIGNDSTSMDGPVSFARAKRGEIPMRKGNPQQALKTGNTDYAVPTGMLPKQGGQEDGGGGDSDIMKQDGLKLRIDLNLDIEIELKAKIYGDLTLALLA